MSLLQLCALLLFAFYAACAVWVIVCWRESVKADGRPGDPAHWDAIDDDMVRHHLQRREADQ